MKKTTNSSSARTGGSPCSLIDAQIAELADWHARCARVRALIREADPDIVETWKWRGVPVFEHDGIIRVGGDLQGGHEADLRQGRRGR
jgi:hypothetical protein